MALVLDAVCLHGQPQPGTRRRRVRRRGLCRHRDRLHASPATPRSADGRGGALAVNAVATASTLLAEDCTFTDNTSAGAGGAIDAAGASVTLRRCDRRRLAQCRRGRGVLRRGCRRADPAPERPHRAGRGRRGELHLRGQPRQPGQRHLGRRRRRPVREGWRRSRHRCCSHGVRVPRQRERAGRRPLRRPLRDGSRCGTAGSSTTPPGTRVAAR